MNNLYENLNTCKNVIFDKMNSNNRLVCTKLSSKTKMPCRCAVTLYGKNDIILIHCNILEFEKDDNYFKLLKEKDTNKLIAILKSAYKGNSICSENKYKINNKSCYEIMKHMKKMAISSNFKTRDQSHFGYIESYCGDNFMEIVPDDELALLFGEVDEYFDRYIDNRNGPAKVNRTVN